MVPSHLIFITKVPLGIWRNTKKWKRSVSTFNEQLQLSTLEGMGFRTPTPSPPLKSIGVLVLYVKTAQCLHRTCTLYITSRWLVTPPYTGHRLWDSSDRSIVSGNSDNRMFLPVQYRYNIFSAYFSSIVSWMHGQGHPCTQTGRANCTPNRRKMLH